MRRFLTFFYYFKDFKRVFIKYSGLSFVVGILELFGVALTYPFILKLLNKTQCAHIYDSPFFIGASIIILFLVKNLFMIYYSNLQCKFTKKVESEINMRFMRYFLYAPYIETSKLSVAKKISILGFIIPNVISNYILRLLNLNVNIFIFCLIAVFLAIKFPLAMLLTMIFSFVVIIIQTKFFKPYLLKRSRMLTDKSVISNQKTNEIIFNIKSVKISGNEEFFFNNYKDAIYDYFKTNTEVTFLNCMPPYIVEPLVIIILFLLLIIISFEHYSTPDKLIASYAIVVTAIFRITPTISRIQVNLNGIHSAIGIVDEFLDLCKNFNILHDYEITEKSNCSFKESLELKNIAFEYEKNKPVLRDINFRVNKGEFIGIAGLSGSGKTTLVDIISGLYHQDSGELYVDGKVLDNSFKSPLKIGYVPQEYSIIKGSIKENVAFGSSVIDEERVILALKQAQLYDFIVKNYPNGIDENPFVDSIGLSQGQKQRLAIARALYSKPNLLILDEATSSLDLKTEEELCVLLKSLKGDITIIAIAHRLSTIKFADKIIFMSNSTISDIGTFEDLFNRNNDFRELVNLSHTK